jgi:hypothetical protein
MNAFPIIQLAITLHNITPLFMMVINIICKFYIIHIITVVGLCQYMYYLIRIYHNTYNLKKTAVITNI